MEETKKCRKCGEYKPLKDFHRKSIAKDGRQVKCKICNHQAVTEWQENNPEKHKSGWEKSQSSDPERVLKRKLKKYQISHDEYTELVNKSNNQCMICKKTPEKGLNIDHCHTSGVVRGLLCNQCNTGLGLFQDNIELLKKAILYLG